MPLEGVREFINLNQCVMKVCNVIAFAGGMLAGSMLALLFAPKKGVELRNDIKGKLDDVKRQVDETVARYGGGCDCKESVQVTVEE